MRSEVGGGSRLSLEFGPIETGANGIYCEEGHALPGKIKGKIVAVSAAGDLITDIAADQLSEAPRDERLVVRCDEHMTLGLFDSSHQEPEMTFLALLGSQGTLELTIVGDSAALMLGLRPGETVVVEWS